ncbi:phytanoyl-CoA dioxygenase family protein [Nocardiopsis composta]|uniref:Ectoine hydroxylase n=1 Tax=Nocardiopsis composta TaxID=157465 RepID=A0A7W8QPS3_9ACTN|nr:phytanoyl-CoA dioxygenase family protein [Nocardiopsis composta]MBB5434345.1 ectoine hydroxylase [Nocardiopsis composta]
MTALTETQLPALDEYPTRKDRAPALLYRTHPTVWGPVEDGPCTTGEIEAYAAAGYVRAGGLLTGDEIRGLAAELDRLRGDDGMLVDDRTAIAEGLDGAQVRSVYEVHRISDAFAELARDPRVVDRARQILGSDVYLYQTRATHVPALDDVDVHWHSDFETWHAEDGMPAPRAVAVSIALTDAVEDNGALRVMPGSHKTFVSCVGETPEDHYLDAGKSQEAGLPDDGSLSIMTAMYGVDVLDAEAGAVTVCDANLMHGTAANATSHPRSELLLVFNSVENTCVDPFSADAPRPAFLGAREAEPIR